MITLNGSMLRGMYNLVSTLTGVQDPILAVNAYFLDPWTSIHPLLDHSKQMSAWDSASGDVDWMITNGHVDATSSWITSTTLPSNFFKTMTVDANDTYFNGKQFRMQWTGAGAMTAPAGATIDSSRANEIVFTLGNVSGTNMQITATSGPITGLTVVETNKAARYDAGERLNPDYTALIADVRQIRFMDWNHTNGSDQDTWASRPIPSQNSYSQDGNGNSITHKAGVPLEIMVELCNRIKADMWLCFPHAATDEYITEAATYVRDNLNSDLICTYEMSNEVWNDGFDVQQDHFTTLGNALWPAGVGVVSAVDMSMSAYGFRSHQMGLLVDTVYSGILSRRQTAINVQTNFLARGLDQLEAPVWQTYAGDPASTSGAYTSPSDTCTHIALTSYFGTGLLSNGRPAVIDAAYPATSDTVIDGYLRETGPAGDEILSLSAVNSQWAAYNTEAVRLGMKMLHYEGGPHMVFSTGSQTQTSRDACRQWIESTLGATFCTDMIDNWASHSEAEGPYMQFQDIGQYSEFGQWTFQEFMEGSPQGYMAQLFTENSGRNNWWSSTADYRHGAL